MSKMLFATKRRKGTETFFSNGLQSVQFALGKNEWQNGSETDLKKENPESGNKYEKRTDGNGKQNVM